ncbi:hypothetical protein AB0I81_42060 [Nonomuraea sp. NPDC050404]|uniref:hypothetical protein n=1 Tax=Nonomuraea sp. NPDC050404 TaxID=3155783 RepID=UPI0033F0EE92
MSSGYNVRRPALDRTGARYGEDADQVTRWRDELKAVFEQEGNPLGDDQYGAALSGQMTQLNNELFDAFDAYIAELEGVRTGLKGSDGAYGAAEQAGSGS